MVLAAIGLAAADVATYTSLRSFLFNRVDVSLAGAHLGAAQSLLRPKSLPPSTDHGVRLLGGGGPTFVQIRTLGGAVVDTRVAHEFPSGKAIVPPKLPAQISLTKTAANGERFRLLNEPARSGAGLYRVRASIDPRLPNRIV